MAEDEKKVRPLREPKLRHHAAVPLAEEEEAGAGGAGEDVGAKAEAEQELWPRHTAQDSTQVWLTEDSSSYHS